MFPTQTAASIRHQQDTPPSESNTFFWRFILKTSLCNTN